MFEPVESEVILYQVWFESTALLSDVVAKSVHDHTPPTFCPVQMEPEVTHAAKLEPVESDVMDAQARLESALQFTD